MYNAIILENIYKEFIIHHEKPTLVEKFVKGRTERFVALKDINLIISKGEKIGIIGANGSGKTTLLKIITGITTPTSGNVKTFGKVISLIDLEAGFHADLTGYQNIFMNGMLLGMSKKEIISKIGSIISFADIKQFIDTPLFTYSSGMKLRLGFSIAIHANPDILILDEGMSIGDDGFQKKANASVQKIYRSNKTVIIVSHWIDYVRDNCTRIVWMDKGEIHRSGDKHILSLYTNAH